MSRNLADQPITKYEITGTLREMAEQETRKGTIGDVRAEILKKAALMIEGMVLAEDTIQERAKKITLAAMADINENTRTQPTFLPKATQRVQDVLELYQQADQRAKRKP